jgi:predicted transcriptional regulator
LSGNDIQKFVNMQKHILSADQHRFVDDVTALLKTRGMPPAAGRIYAYLLICDEPVGLDRIALDLGMSKSGVSTMGRVLEHCGVARRHAVPGTKRVLYGPSDDGSAQIAEQSRVMGVMAGLLGRAAAFSERPETADRLAGMADFHRAIQAAMDHVLEDRSAPAKPSSPRLVRGRAAD